MPAAKTGTIRLERLTEAEITIPVEGVTPIIPHKWSEKAKRMMRAKQSGQTVRQKREPKDPQEDAMAACYWLDDASTIPGIPATAFKGAMVDACRFFEAPTMMMAKRMIFVVGEGVDQLIRLDGKSELREDIPRNETGVVDLRYRYQFYPWSAQVTIRFPQKLITPESIATLLDAAGRNGVGDWRPGAPKSNTGTFGQFRVAVSDEELQGEVS